MLLEEGVKGAEPAQDVLGEVGAVDAQDQVIAAAAQELALEFPDPRAARDRLDRAGIDRQWIGAHPYLASST